MNIDSYKNFEACLKLGQLMEEKAIDRIIKHFDNEYRLTERCDDYKYDFKLSNGLSYEVKSDLLSIKTGNIYLENVSRGKESGISRTKAHFYIIITQTENQELEYHLIDVKTLKLLIKKNLYSYYKSDELKSGYIFSKQKLFKYCICF